MALLSEASALRTVRSNLPYWEMAAVAEKYVDEGTHATRQLACYWKDKSQFLLDLVGFPYVSGTAGTTGALLRRHLPERHPGFDPETDFFDMWCVDAAVVGGAGWHGRSELTGAIRFHDSPPEDDFYENATRAENGEGLCLVEAAYAPTIYDVLSDDEVDGLDEGERARYLFVTREPAAENLPYPKHFLYYKADPPDYLRDEDVPELPPQLFPQTVYRVNWIAVPEDAYREKTVEGYTDDEGVFVPGGVGSINETAFLGKAPGTLLCLAPQVRQYIHASTAVLLDVSFPMAFRPQGWNYFLRNNGKFYQAFRRLPADTEDGPFLPFEFAAMFDVASE